MIKKMEEIARVEFSASDGSLVRDALSCVHVVNPTAVVDFTRAGSLHDPRMGAFKNIPCGTCASSSGCPGHFGHIELPVRVLHPLFRLPGARRVPSRGAAAAAGVRWEYEVAGVRAPCPSEIPGDDKYFVQVLPVLPIASRQPNFVDGAWRPQHLTRMYVDIMRRAAAVRARAGMPSPLRAEAEWKLQNAVNVLFDSANTVRCGGGSGGNAANPDVGGLRQRIDGKAGRVRMNLMGKRVDFSARSVLSGDPQLGVDEVGVPPSIARTLTVPVVVTWSTSHVRGARYLRRGEDRYDLSAVAVPMLPGDIVERSLQDGDVVAVNRQPTLHRGSMIGCRVRILPCDTIRLNLAAMLPLNADCDGDEVNLHVPQCDASRAELETLMMASSNIVSSQSSAPLIGCTQDALLGLYLLSQDLVDARDFEALLYAGGMDVTGARVTVFSRGARLVPGGAIAECALAEVGVHVGYLEIARSGFVIREGRVLAGVLDKHVVGVSPGSLVHHVFLSAGAAAAGRFIHHLQRAAASYLDLVGFSVGIQDCVVPDSAPPDLRALDALLRDEGDAVDEALLAEATGALTRQETRARDNSLVDMLRAGSKGSLVNFNQVTRVVGQQTVGPGRVAPEFRGGRTLPHFRRGDNTLQPRGFVDRSFLQGLRPHQFFFHAMSGRVGLIDTACKTSETGAQYRRLVKVMERAVVAAGQEEGDERMVVDPVTGDVIQFNYGDDGLDGTFLLPEGAPVRRETKRLKRAIT